MAKTTAEKIAVMQAYLDGKKVQMRVDGKWRDLVFEPCWDGNGFPYRIKPQTVKESEQFMQPMELRDYFAGQAIEGILARSRLTGTKKSFAKFAYQMADEMLKAREQSEDKVEC